MTLDTATLRAQWEAIREQQGPAAFGIVAHVGDGIALLDALEAERERVRVLTAALERICFGADHENGVADAPDWYASQAWSSTIACTALATAGGEGATT